MDSFAYIVNILPSRLNLAVPGPLTKAPLSITVYNSLLAFIILSWRFVLKTGRNQSNKPYIISYLSLTWASPTAISILLAIN